MLVDLHTGESGVLNSCHMAFAHNWQHPTHCFSSSKMLPRHEDMNVNVALSSDHWEESRPVKTNSILCAKFKVKGIMPTPTKMTMCSIDSVGLSQLINLL